MSKQDLILHSVNYFDSLSGKMVNEQTIRITDNMISWIGDASSYEQVTDDQVIDLTGAFVLPGLIDCHIHLGYNAIMEYERAYLRTKTPTYGYLALKNAQRHLIAGLQHYGTVVVNYGGHLSDECSRKTFSMVPVCWRLKNLWVNMVIKKKSVLMN